MSDDSPREDLRTLPSLFLYIINDHTEIQNIKDMERCGINLSDVAF